MPFPNDERYKTPESHIKLAFGLINVGIAIALSLIGAAFSAVAFLVFTYLIIGKRHIDDTPLYNMGELTHHGWTNVILSFLAVAGFGGYVFKDLSEGKYKPQACIFYAIYCIGGFAGLYLTLCVYR